MIRQLDRSAATIADILAGARKLFASEGFDTTSIDDIAAKAGVAKGAVYHHFASKEEIFTRVLEDVQAEIAAMPPPAATRAMKDPLDQIAAETLRYLLAATEPSRKRILLIDGPAVIGWKKWREIDDRFFGAGAKMAMTHVLGAQAPQREIDAATHLMMGAVMEACLVCATAPDAKKAARELSAGLRRMLEGLRR
ncbi:MAG: TetR/AcrR family transcriptional regulator [Rhizomicrobium sp.]